MLSVTVPYTSLYNQNGGRIFCEFYCVLLGCSLFAHIDLIGHSTLQVPGKFCGDSAMGAQGDCKQLF